LSGYSNREARREDHLDLEPEQLTDYRWYLVHAPFERSTLDDNVLPLDVAEFAQTFQERSHVWIDRLQAHHRGQRRVTEHDGDPRRRRRLLALNAKRRDEHGSEASHEGATIHYSIT
jgi:hypothetical protein